MRNILAAFIAIAAFTATVALVNAMGGAEGGLSFDIAEATENLALMLGESLAAWASEIEFALPNPGLIAQLLGAFALSLPAVFAFALFSE